MAAPFNQIEIDKLLIIYTKFPKIHPGVFGKI